MARILPFSIMAGGFVVAVIILATLILTQEAAAQTEQGSLACVDSNKNGRIDRAEVINVIRQYFSSDPIPAPAPSSRDGTSRSKAFEYGEEFDAGILNMQIVAIDTDAWPEIQAENNSMTRPQMDTSS